MRSGLQRRGRGGRIRASWFQERTNAGHAQDSTPAQRRTQGGDPNRGEMSISSEIYGLYGRSGDLFRVMASGRVRRQVMAFS